MKYFLTFVSVLFFSMYSSFGQQPVDDLRDDSAKIYVAYNYYRGYQNDSIYNKIIHGSLYLGSKGSVYLFQYQTVEEFTKAFEKSIKQEQYKEFIMSEMKKYKDREWSLTHIYAKYYEAPEFLKLVKFNDEYGWLRDTMNFDWKLTNEYKMIEGYKVQKAIATVSDGRDVIAWFTEDIPISSGPDRISGLPGLVMEYHNPYNKNFYKATEITSENIPSQQFRNWLNGPLFTRAKYDKLMEENLKMAGNLRRMINSGKVNRNEK